MLAASFVLNQTCDVCFWHIASFRCAAKLDRYWRHSGQVPASTLTNAVANDTKRTTAQLNICSLGSDAIRIGTKPSHCRCNSCLLYTSDAADEEDSVDLGGRRIIKKK